MFAIDQFMCKIFIQMKHLASFKELISKYILFYYRVEK